MQEHKRMDADHINKERMNEEHLSKGRTDKVLGDGDKGFSGLMAVPRIVIAAAGSGCGKTTITCGVLKALLNKNLRPVSFKCGPDYIDPMFHSEVLSVKSRNLDLFFMKEETAVYLLGKNAMDSDIAVIEGVMGYYDGLGAVSEKASSYDVARATGSPAVLLVDAKGKSYSILAEIKGFLDFKEESQIQGVILNRISPMLYDSLKEAIERELGVQVYGYLPKMEDCLLESRHLGLVTAAEIDNLKGIIETLGKRAEETVDIDGLMALAKEAPPLRWKEPDEVKAAKERGAARKSAQIKAAKAGAEKLVTGTGGRRIPIGVAMDKAFCFYYQDNLDLLSELGAEIVSFSPLEDDRLPEGICGLILGGGYPELYLPKLESNRSMKEDVRSSIQGGLPCLAECGGFMYLHEELEDTQENSFQMTGVIPGKSFPVNKLVRFGYIGLTAREETVICKEGESVKGHEFHYWDSTNPGGAFRAVKPSGKRSWDCLISEGNLLAGYPHLHYYSNPACAARFLEACREYGARQVIPSIEKT